MQVEDWAARMQWRGRRETLNLKTPNKAAAAAKAKDIYTMLIGAGWDATLEKFKPEMARKSVSTVGDFLTELEDRFREESWRESSQATTRANHVQLDHATGQEPFFARIAYACELAQAGQIAL